MPTKPRAKLVVKRPQPVMVWIPFLDSHPAGGFCRDAASPG
ncbi:MAG: hypothetical protein ACRD1K_17205 [Acidimicrobiales bacterium]